MNIQCCKDCKDRKLGCHGTCKIYLSERASLDEHKRLIIEGRQKQQSTITTTMVRNLKKSGKWKMR